MSRRDAITDVATGYGLRRRDVYTVVHALSRGDGPVRAGRAGGPRCARSAAASPGGDQEAER